MRKLWIFAGVLIFALTVPFRISVPSEAIESGSDYTNANLLDFKNPEEMLPQKSFIPVPDGVGYVEGFLSFPGHEVPPHIVCARLEDRVLLYCASSFYDADAPYGVGYELRLPPGRYVVFAERLIREYDIDHNYQACFSGYTPGIGKEEAYPLPERTPVIVEVRAGERITGIHPVDWGCPKTFPRPDEELLGEFLKKFPLPLPPKNHQKYLVVFFYSILNYGMCLSLSS